MKAAFATVWTGALWSWFRQLLVFTCPGSWIIHNKLLAARRLFLRWLFPRKSKAIAQDCLHAGSLWRVFLCCYNLLWHWKPWFIDDNPSPIYTVEFGRETCDVPKHAISTFSMRHMVRSYSALCAINFIISFGYTRLFRAFWPKYWPADHHRNLTSINEDGTCNVIEDPTLDEQILWNLHR